MLCRKLPSLCSVAVSDEAPSCRGEISKRALLRDLPERGTRSGRIGSGMSKSALSSCTVTAVSSTPCGKSDPSANGAAVSASACWPTSTSKASVYQVPAARMVSAAWSSSATLTNRCPGAAAGSGGPGALLLPTGGRSRYRIGRIGTTFSWVSMWNCRGCCWISALAAGAAPRSPPPSSPPRGGAVSPARPGESVAVGGNGADSAADQNACATSGWAMSLCAPDAPPPFLMIALASRL